MPLLSPEICLLTNAKRVASVRAETYCNLFSLSVEHFISVLEHYPVMRRTMESVAAERLNKIGKNPSIVSNRDDIQEDMNTVNELIMQTTPLSSSGSESSINQDKKQGKKFKKVKKDKPHDIDTDNTFPLKKSKSDCFVSGIKSDSTSPGRHSPGHEGEEESLV